MRVDPSIGFVFPLDLFPLVRTVQFIGAAKHCCNTKPGAMQVPRDEGTDHDRHERHFC
jgi:hypothetical protein